MSAPIATLERLMRVRERMRDVAAAAATQRQSAVAAARADVGEAERAREALLDRAPLGARSVHALVDHGDAIASAKQAVAELGQVVVARQAVAQQAAAALGERERALRGVERMLKGARAERDERVRHAEQRLADDLAAVRRR